MKSLNLIFGIILFSVTNLSAQVGYYDAPYTRYEADQGTLVNASATTRSYNQGDLQSEASEQVCVNLSNSGASVQWTATAAGDGLVVRYSVPDGQSGVIEVFANGTSVGTLNLSSYYSWEYLSTNGNPNNAGVVNNNPKMRFDEVRMKLPSVIPVGGTLRLVRQSGNIHIDFAELELVPAAVGWSSGNVTYTGNGSNLQDFIDANGGATIYLPAGTYNVSRDLYFGVANTTLKGAGMWYTRIHFTSGAANDGGLWGQASNISYSGLYLTTDRNSRSNSYKGINGVYTSGSTITNVWVEHFECGAWIAQFGSGPTVADGFTMSNCRFRNNYADGTNLSKGTRNAVVEHCSYRNNGDDDMAIWSANNQECQNNTFRYNTSENTWRASGCAIYGGLSNKAHNLLIQDNLEVGLKCNNAFGGAPFNSGGMHEFYNIIIKRCGTNNDLFNRAVGAIDLGSYDWGAGTRVQNVKFSCIEIIDSKNDAIYIKKATSGSDGLYNLVFENITINGTGREYPGNNNGGNTTRGYGILFKDFPNGSATYCGITYANRGGNAGSDINTAEKGSLSWTAAGSCPGGCSLATSSTNITSASTFGVCNTPITITATTTAPAGNTVNNIEFFVDNVSIGQDNSSAYSMAWSSPTVGDHQFKAVASYSGGTTSTHTQNVVVADGIYSTSTVPVIDGTIDAVWGSYSAFPLNIVSVGSVSGAADLSATFQITRDATNLYILVNVTDDDLRNDSPENYNDDAVELFIDMGNDKPGSYQGSDYQYSFAYNDATPQTGLTFAQGTKTGGYIFEIRIPWTTLGGAPSAGSFMGFDLHVDDDDGGGTRDAKKAWEDATDNAWQNPSVFGTLQVAGCSNPFLPVELLSFTGEVENGLVVLHWATATETNNAKFVIERSLAHSESGWESIGEVAGVGNSVSVTSYRFPDHSPQNGMLYYRLRQVDIDGTFTYSNVIAIKITRQDVSVVNPFEDILTIRTTINDEMNVSIHDVLGRLMYQESHKISNGSVSIAPSLSPGSYIITIQAGGFIEKQNIIKK